jgi:hypothetical protein
MVQIKNRLVIRRASSNLDFYLSSFPDLLERFIERSRTKWECERWEDHHHMKDCMAMRLMMQIEDRFRHSRFEITNNYFRDNLPPLLEEEELGLVMLHTSILLNSDHMMMQCFFNVPEFHDLIHVKVRNNRRFVHHLIENSTFHPIIHCGYLMYVFGDIWLEWKPRHVWESCHTTQKVLYVLVNHSLVYDRFHELSVEEQAVELLFENRRQSNAM